MAELKSEGVNLAAVCQITATEDKEKTFSSCRRVIETACKMGAKMIFLPEACDNIQRSPADSVNYAEGMDGPTMSAFKQLAKEHKVWLSIGGFHEKNPEDDSKMLNTHVILDDRGDVVSRYSKTHLFSVDIQGQFKLDERDCCTPGKTIVPPVDTPLGKVGLGICYDLRFPEFSMMLTRQGAEILTFPSAFTIPTGMAHWEPLLRSRAIENQCYVIAAAQTGKHNDGRASYGHAMIVDPWGAVVAHCSEGEGVAVAQIDHGYLQKVRTSMPVWDHRRTDLYPTF
nr:deaminated glutathione amidase-like [Lytechinus pictus]